MKEYIHRFRNALVRAADSESYRFHKLGRWNELNSFPYGSCDIASNFLAFYLENKGFKPKVIWCNNTLEQYENVKSHVWLEIDNKFVDITISQFHDYSHKRIHISNKNEPTMLNEIYKHCKELGHHNYQERSIDINNATTNGMELYQELCKLADSL